jgi:hypothetical protein
MTKDNCPDGSALSEGLGRVVLTDGKHSDALQCCWLCGGR